MRPNNFLAATTCLLLTASASSTAWGAGGEGSVGTLTCTATERNLTEDGVWRNLDCSYQPTGAAAAKLKGTMAKFGLEAAGKGGPRVLIWLVYGAGVDAVDLEGAFVRNSSDRASETGPSMNALIGGRANSVKLVPSDAKRQVAGDPALTVIELQLSALKV